MEEQNRYFVRAGINKLIFPVNISSKYLYKEQSTIAEISVSASVDRQYGPYFRNNIIKVLNNCGMYTSINFLADSILKYMDTLNSKDATINIVYPYFTEEASDYDRQFIRHRCRYTLSKSSLINYLKSFAVEMPVLLDYPKGSPTAPLIHLITEADGFVTLFAEDIIDIVKQNLNCSISSSGYYIAQNAQLLLQKSFTEKIQNELITKYEVDKCSVKVKGAEQLISKSVKYKMNKDIVSEAVN